MTQRNRGPAGIAAAATLALLAVGACATDDDPGRTAAASTSSTYATRSFVLPIDVTVPDWVPTKPSIDEPNFLTWVGADTMVDRAVRFLVPVTVYQPGVPTPTAVPTDYLAYLRTQAEHGGTFTDETATTVDGQPATVMTATSTASLDGSLGCPADEITAGDCFGLQPHLALRIAVIDVDGTTLLAWAKVTDGSAATSEVFADFEQMLASLRFR